MEGVTATYNYYHDHGQCYTFGPPTNASYEKPIAGQKNGYKIFFQYMPGNHTDTDMYPGGMDIFIHDPYEDWTGRCVSQGCQVLKKKELI